jgi:hypothetical protein
MKRSFVLAVAALLAAALGARASDPVGIYALIEKVIQEPKEGTPDRIQVWGVFVIGSNGGREHSAPTRGSMFFTLAKGKEELCRREWADLKRVAGTGEVVAFGSSRAPTGTIRKPKAKVEPAAPLEAAKLADLIADLGSEEFAAREKATRLLASQGDHAHPALQKALDGKVSAEARRRIERLLAREKPDPYPLGFGLTKLDGDYGRHWVNLLGAVPAPVSPAEGSAIEPGKVTLKTKNVACSDHKSAGYVFEIEEATSGKEESPVVAAAEKETEWTPRMEIKAGKKYTWRVHPVDGKWKGPNAETSFLGKAAQ